MQTAREIINDIIRKEGGFTNDPLDRGHQYRRSKGDKWDSYCTNMGVTQYTLSDWLGRQASVEEVRSLSHETAFEIYETKYFSTPRINTLPTLIQPFMTDAAVNHGAPRAIKWMQQVVNLAGFGPVDTDGVVGPQSRKAAERAVDEMGAFFVNALVELRIQFFEGLVERDPTQAKYLKGWKARANSFRMEV